jgi:hypothetical protein
MEHHDTGSLSLTVSVGTVELVSLAISLVVFQKSPEWSLLTPEAE